MLPLKIAGQECFDAACRFLLNAGYTTDGICRHLGIESLDQASLKAVTPGRPIPADNALDVLVTLFFASGLVARNLFHAHLGDEAYAAFDSLGLVMPYGDAYCATVMLYPIEHIYICSDRPTNADGSEARQIDDFVFPARSIPTQRILRIAPRSGCDSLLDLCSGTGVFALLGASQARRAFAFDIAPRSTHFAEFNRRLNGIENVSCATGDLYEPAGDLTFDRIIAHPPYVPALKSELIYHDGGEDGESVLRGVIQGLPKYLRPGGRLYCGALGSDRFEAPFEQRVREMLGPAEADFDVALIVRQARDPQDFAVADVLSHARGIAELKQWAAIFRTKRIEKLNFCTIVVQRRSDARRTFTARRQKRQGTTRQVLDWTLDWETAATRPEVASAILQSRLHAAPDTELYTKHVIEDADWKPCAFMLETSHPFEAKAEVESWTAFLLSRAQGQTGSELLELLKREEILQPDTPADQFARALTPLISGGFLYCEAHPLPKPEVRQTVEAESLDLASPE